MNIVDHNVGDDPHELAEDLLTRPLVCVVGMLSTDGNAPRVSPLWFLWADESRWILGDMEETHTTRLEHDPRVAVAIVNGAGDAGCLQHLGMRGSASFEPYDGQRAFRLRRRYVGSKSGGVGFNHVYRSTRGEDEQWTFVRISPETVVLWDFSDDVSGRWTQLQTGRRLRPAVLPRYRRTGTRVRDSSVTVEIGRQFWVGFQIVEQVVLRIAQGVPAL